MARQPSQHAGSVLERTERPCEFASQVIHLDCGGRRKGREGEGQGGMYKKVVKVQGWEVRM